MKNLKKSSIIRKESDIIKPIKITGAWNEGIVISNHMLKSTFLGYDEKGNEIFKNKRTELGELIYKFKYKNDKKCLDKIMNILKPILDNWNIKEQIDIVIPVPPSNKNRIYQPVCVLAKEISIYLNKEYDSKILFKLNNIQAKDGSNIKNTIIQNSKIKEPSNILVIDDLYSSGSTLNEVCKVLKKDKNVKRIYCLVMTKTKR